MEGSAAAVEWDDETFERVLDRLRTEATIDAAGVRISAERLDRIVKAAPERLLKDADFRGATFVGDAYFADATFTRDTYFDSAAFTGRAVFDKATFTGSTHFTATFSGGSTYFEATFTGDTYFNEAAFHGNNYFGKAAFHGSPFFRKATFEDAAFFPKATFESDAFFGETTFNGDAHFVEATFNRRAEFDQAEFGGETSFEGAEFRERASFQLARFAREAQFAGEKAVIFNEWADFRGATFTGGVWFGGASFKDRAMFVGAAFDGLARFEGATFERARTFGPLIVRGTLKLDRASFRAPVRLEISAEQLSCIGTTFEGPATLQVRGAELRLDESVFDRASTLALSPPLLWETSEEGHPALPRLASLRGADVANLTLADISLESCVFESTLNLDQLRLATVCPFDETPPSPLLNVTGLHSLRRWTKRDTICEERGWRVARGQEDWKAKPVDCAVEAKEELASEAERLAKTYRALRKGREDEGNAPGAGDFYYGEMEMRRAAKPPWAERVLLWLYWLVSGYGLRGSRALIALALTVVVFAFLFGWWGFRPDQSLGRGLLFSMESTSSLFRVPETKDFALTAGGEVLQVILRLLGPLFFGLALLSLRGRVKR
jgi:uncharacterized protein YjbI with pentapeptide repeats